jgi:hypothetical protein
MNGRCTFLGNAPAAVVMAKISSLRSFAFATDGPETIGPSNSDREKAGLRSPVRTHAEDTVNPDGGKYSITTGYEYSPDGRIFTFRFTNSDGSGWFRAQTYELMAA